MQEINEELENDRSVLEWMLGQYVRAKRRKKQLEIRLLEINAERDSPIGGQGYDPLPRSGGNNEGAAGILMKLADIEDRIYEQKAKADKSMVNVATILNFLPEESMEREICELRHIDGHEWGEIAEGIPMSKSQCHRIHKAAMYELLEFNYVKELVMENRESYEYYIEKKEEARYRRENQATGTQAGQEAGHTARPGSRTHPAATRAARTAQGSQGTKASSTPASDERCDSMHHLHVI